MHNTFTAAQGDVELLQVLIDHNAPINTKDHAGFVRLRTHFPAVALPTCSMHMRASWN